LLIFLQPGPNLMAMLTALRPPPVHLSPAAGAPLSHTDSGACNIAEARIRELTSVGEIQVIRPRLEWLPAVHADTIGAEQVVICAE
jgi:hypothetical protein